MKEIIIDENSENQRFDRFLRKYFKTNIDVSLGDIFSRIRKKHIRLNWSRAKENVRLVKWDVISFHNIDDLKAQKIASDKKAKKELLKPEEIAKYIAYEDDHWIGRNKPPHMVIHPWNKHTEDLSLHDILQIHTQHLQTETFKPSFCYRLDKNTSWICIAAKSYEALQLLNKLIRERDVEKYYYAIVSGIPPKSETINAPIFKGFNSGSGRSQSFINHQKWLEAKTSYETIWTRQDDSLGEIALLKVKIYTGRMHQIRVHLAHAGYPVIWDLTYGNNAINRILYKKYQINRQLLHASEYSFYDSIQKKELTLQAPLPKDFLKLFPKH